MNPSGVTKSSQVAIFATWLFFCLMMERNLADNCDCLRSTMVNRRQATTKIAYLADSLQFGDFQTRNGGIAYRSVLKIRSRRIGLTPTFSCHGRAQASLALLIGLIEKVVPSAHLSLHGSVQASLALLIWLIEKVLQDVESQNVS